MKTPRYKQVTVPKVEGYDVSCDLCGFNEDDTLIFQVVVQVDPDGCCATDIRRDVCDVCYHDRIGPVLDNVFPLMLAGDERFEEEDRWNG
jgi:hypothetical protein